MSKNTAKVAQAISLLSDVLSGEVESELNEVTETVDTDEYDELKEQAIDFSTEVADDLSIISDDLERILDSASDADVANDIDWLADYEDDDVDVIDNEPEPDTGNGEVDISDRIDYETGADEAADPLDGRMLDYVGTAVGVPHDGKHAAPPMSVSADQHVARSVLAVLSEKNAKLEKNNKELTDKIEDLTCSLRAVAAQIENLHTAADTFVNEVESL